MGEKQIPKGNKQPYVTQRTTLPLLRSSKNTSHVSWGKLSSRGEDSSLRARPSPARCFPPPPNRWRRAAPACPSQAAPSAILIYGECMKRLLLIACLILPIA